MPLFKGVASKSTPHKALGYITNPNKAKYISAQNLFEDENFAKQFQDTMKRFGKGKKRSERKYYHFKLSPNRKDNATACAAHLYAEAMAKTLFSDCECVIATHTDTKTVHSHIIVNAVNPLTGKKLRFTERIYTKMKDEANRIGRQFGFYSLDFRKKSQNKRTAQETHIILKGGTSWKEDLREVIEEAKKVSTTQEEFISHLKLYGVAVTRSKTEYSFLHPEKQKAIRGKRLGENYSKEIIDYAVAENGHGRKSCALDTVTGDQRKQKAELGKLPAQRSVGDIQREIERVNQTAEQAHRGFAEVGHPDGTHPHGHNGQSNCGNENRSSQGGKTSRGNRRTSQKGGFEFSK